MSSSSQFQSLVQEKNVLLEQKAKLGNEHSLLAHAILKYEVFHNVKVNSLVVRILNVKTQLAARKARAQPGDFVAQQEYQEAKDDEAEFVNSFEQLLDEPATKLPLEQENEIKTKYWKIARSVHDDCVHPRFLTDAVELFIKAKNAKRANDLQAINLLYDYLEKENPFPSKFESLSEEEVLKKEIKHLYYLIQQLAEDIVVIKNNEPYLTIAEIDNWDIYFDGIRIKLESELTTLQNMLNEQ